MTDSSFQQMGRAPVDELFAGRFSVHIDDEEFAEREERAKEIRLVELANKDWTIAKFMKDGASKEEAELYWMALRPERGSRTRPD